MENSIDILDDMLSTVDDLHKSCKEETVKGLHDTGHFEDPLDEIEELRERISNLQMSLKNIHQAGEESRTELEAYFLEGTDASGFECLTNGYPAILGGQENHWLVICAEYTQTVHSEDDEGDYQFKADHYDPAGLVETWNDLPEKVKEETFQIHGMEEPPSLDTESRPDMLHLAGILNSTGYLDLGYSGTAETYWGVIQRVI